jgi:DnaJ-class molecular chaperone
MSEEIKRTCPVCDGGGVVWIPGQEPYGIASSRACRACQGSGLFVEKPSPVSGTYAGKPLRHTERADHTVVWRPVTEDELVDNGETYYVELPDEPDSES